MVYAELVIEKWHFSWLGQCPHDMLSTSTSPLFVRSRLSPKLELRRHEAVDSAYERLRALPICDSLEKNAQKDLNSPFMRLPTPPQMRIWLGSRQAQEEQYEVRTVSALKLSCLGKFVDQVSIVHPGNSTKRHMNMGLLYLAMERTCSHTSRRPSTGRSVPPPFVTHQRAYYKQGKSFIHQPRKTVPATPLVLELVRNACFLQP